LTKGYELSVGTFRRTAAVLTAAVVGSTFAAGAAHATTVTSGYDTSNGTGVIGPAAPGDAITRAQITTRAQDWISGQVPYSQTEGWQDSAVGGPYRMDCSGFVSMAWALPTSMVTWTLPQVATVTDANISGDANLNPGDALDDTADHVALFDHWTDGSGDFAYDAEHTYGQLTNQSTDNIDNSTLEGYAMSDFEALRYDNVTTPTMPAGGELEDVTGDGETDILSTGLFGALNLYQNGGRPAPDIFDIAPVQVGSGWVGGYSVAAVGDLWGQGRAGILGTGPGSLLNYYPNSGQGAAGRFNIAPTEVGTGFAGYTVIGLTDLFGTGHKGLLAMDPSGDLDYFPNTGNTGAVGSSAQTFGTPIKVGTGFSGYTVDVADMNGDAKPDLLAVAPNGNLEFFPNTGGSGAIGSAKAVFASDTVVGAGFSTMTVADTAFLTGAKGADLVVVTSSGDLKLFANHGGTGAPSSADPMFTGSGTQIGEGWTGLTLN
jgi:hypothetical protein